MTSHTGIIGGNPQVYVYTVYNGAIRHNGKTGTDANKDITLYKTASSTGWGEGWSTISQKSDETNQYSKGYGFTLQNFSLTDTDTADGTFGSLKWHYRDDIKELSFSGSGSISDFSLSALPKWNGGQGRSFRQSIKTIDASKATITAVGNYAFYNADQLEKVTFGSGLKRVGKYAFADCKKIGKFSFAQNASLMRIGDGMLQNASSLSKIKLPGRLRSIPDHTFRNAVKLENCQIGSSVTKIGNSAFQGCKKLQRMILPGQVQTIGKRTFYQCKKLKKVTIRTVQLRKIGKEAFKGCASKIQFAVPKGKQTVYAKLLKGKYGK